MVHKIGYASYFFSTIDVIFALPKKLSVVGSKSKPASTVSCCSDEYEKLISAVDGMRSDLIFFFFLSGRRTIQRGIIHVGTPVLPPGSYAMAAARSLQI
mmetsp:Transcript_15143/g.23010  ORF Transcript_15143/g.23010 Transcript_15143/m.23010 type:complete len:99 (+) Transcript_15143:80-376(+)